MKYGFEVATCDDPHKRLFLFGMDYDTAGDLADALIATGQAIKMLGSPEAVQRWMALFVRRPDFKKVFEEKFGPTPNPAPEPTHGE